MFWKDGLSKKNRTGVWSFLYYQERWYFFFPKIWPYTLDEKWKMIFLKKYMEIWYFLQAFWKDGLTKRSHAGTWSFLYYLERWYFFPKKMIFFPCTLGAQLGPVWPSMYNRFDCWSWKPFIWEFKKIYIPFSVCGQNSIMAVKSADKAIFQK